MKVQWEVFKILESSLFARTYTMRLRLCLTTILVFFTQLLVMAQTGPLANATARGPSSFASDWQEACKSLLEVRTFDAAVFDAEVEKLKKNNGASDDEVKAAMGRPEKILAIAEFNTEGVGFSERLKTLKKKDLQHLYQLIYGATEAGSISDPAREELIIKVYRLSHRPHGVLRTAWQTKNLATAFDMVSDQVIKEHEDLILLNDGMEKAFKSVVADATLTERFEKVLRDQAGWVDTTIAVSLYAISIYWSHDLNPILMWVPPVLSTFEQFFKQITPDNIRAFLRKEKTEEDPEAIKAERAELRTLNNNRILRSYVRATYSFVYSVVLATVMYPVIHADIEKDHQDQVTDHYNHQSSEVKNLADFSKLTPEEKGIANFNDLVDFMRKQGVKVDVNSKDMQAEKRRQIEIQQNIANQSKKKPDPR